MVLLLVAGVVLTTCIVAVCGAWWMNLFAKRKRRHAGYEFGRRAGLGEVALDYIARRTGVNNISLVMTLDGEMDPKILATVLRRAQCKYALFRTRLQKEASTCFQVLSFFPSLPPIPIAQVRGADWRQVFHAEVNTPFTGMVQAPYVVYPLVRTVIITSPRNVDAKCALLVTVDHRLADGFSSGIIFDEIMKDYSAVASAAHAATPSAASDIASDCTSATLADAPAMPQVPLDPPTEELGPAWLMLPRLLLKLVALASYIAVCVWRFRGFTRLPLRMSAAEPTQASLLSPHATTDESRASASASASAADPMAACEDLCAPEPPPTVRGLSHLSGLFLAREPSVTGTLRVPWTTAAEFTTLSEAQTTALLAACKRERVTITAALFAAMSIAIAEKEIQAGQARFPLMVYSYTLLDLRKLSRSFLNPVRLGLHISSIFSIASLGGKFDDALFWAVCRKYQADKRRSFMWLEPWRNLLLQWLLAHAAVFISMCNFYHGRGHRLVNWLGKALPSLSPTFAISNMGSLDHFQWTNHGPRLPHTPMVKEIYGAATIPVSWPFCLLLSSSVNGCLKLNFAFSPQALPRPAVEALSERVVELLDAVAANDAGVAKA